MNIILFTNRGGQVWNFVFRPMRVLAVLLLGTVLVVAGALYIGTRIGGDEQEYVAQWNGEIQLQQAEIEELRKSARADLDALTLRIGQMQGELLRLNALGERLVSQGDLDKAEFNFDEAPAVGGPHEATVGASAGLGDILGMLDGLDAELADRKRKLSVLESVLMNRSLTERVMPSGRPVQEGWLSSRYGKRNDPFTGKQDFHPGLDFAGKKGSEVLAVADGVVNWSGKRSGYGNLIEVNHGNGYVTRYGHNLKNLVQVGDTVKKGQQIALMGSTGRSTGPHVHLEVLRDGKTVNPARFIGK